MGSSPIDTHQPVATSWGEIENEDVRSGVRRCGFGTDDVLLVRNELDADADLNPHSHTFAQIALILEGDGFYHIGEVAHEIKPGSVLLIPPGEMHYLEPRGGKVVNLDVFSPARGDLLHLLDWMPRASDGS